MATGALRTNFADKRNMPQNRVKDTFFDYLLLRLQEIASRVWRGQAGIFGSTSLISGGTDRFSVSGPFPVYAIDGDGNIIELDAGNSTLVYFENEAAIVYSVGVRHALIPSGVVQNPRIPGVIFYDTDEDEIGERAEPDSVVEVAGTLEIEVDSVCEAGVSTAGRSVTVWLKRPRTTEEAVAIERNLTVAFSGGKNVVTTSGLLGQGSPASTNVADYQVALQGLTVKRNTDLSATDPYAFIGTVTGGGAGNPPSGFSVLGQIDVSDGLHPDLQNAYVLGRTITPSAAYGGAVKIESADSGDEVNSLLVLNRKGATEAAPQNLVTLLKRGDGASLVTLLPFQDLTDLQEDEPGTTAAAGVVDLTRVGVDLVAAGIGGCHDLVQLWDFTPTAGMNRFYRISSRTATQITLLNLDGTAVVAPWGAAETGNVSILRMRLTSAESGAFGGGVLSARAVLTLTGQEKLGADDTLLRLVPTGARNSLVALDPADNEVALIERDGTFKNARFDQTGYFQTGFMAEMGDVSAAPFVSVQPQSNASSLLAQEDVTLAGSVVTFPRVVPIPVDLTAGGYVHKQLHLLLIEDSDDPADNGIYTILSFTATTINAIAPDGSVPVFVGPNAKARVILPRFVAANWLPFSTNAELIGGTTITLQDGEKNSAPLRIIPHKASGLILALYNRGNLTTDEREPCVFWTMATDGANYQPLLQIGDENLSSEPVHCGLKVVPHPGRDADLLAINVHPLPPRQTSGESLYNRALGLHNYDGAEMLRLEQGGRIARVSEFFDDFPYQSQPHASIWSEVVSGGTVFWDAGEDGVGVVRATASGVGNYGGIGRFGQHYMRHATAAPAIDRILNFAGRFRPLASAGELPDFLQMRVECYLQFVGSFKLGCLYEAVAANDQFRFFAYDGVTENLTAGKGAAGPDGDERGWFKFWMRLRLAANRIVVSWDREESANSNGIDEMNFPTPASTSWEGKCYVGARVTSKNANTHGIEVDYLHVWDEILKSGAKDRES